MTTKNVHLDHIMEKYEAELMPLRAAIDEIDAEIVELLGRRFSVCREVSTLKAQFDAPSVDLDREEIVFAHRRELADRFGVPPATIENIYRLIVTQVVHEHHRAKLAAELTL